MTTRAGSSGWCDNEGKIQVKRRGVATDHQYNYLDHRSGDLAGEVRMNSEVLEAFVKCLVGLAIWLFPVWLLLVNPPSTSRKNGKIVRRRIISQAEDNQGRPVFLVEAQNFREAGRFVDGWTYPGDCSWKIQSQGNHEYKIFVSDWDNK